MARLQMYSIPNQALYNNLPSLQEANDACKVRTIFSIAVIEFAGQTSQQRHQCSSP